MLYLIDCVLSKNDGFDLPLLSFIGQSINALVLYVGCTNAFEVCIIFS